MTKEEKVKAAIEALKALKDKMSGGGYRQSGDVTERVTFDGNTIVSFDIRYWGDWVNPEDAEDEEDYDWKVLTPESRQRLKELTEEYGKRYGVEIYASAEEKCWITLTVMINRK